MEKFSFITYILNQSRWFSN